MLRIQQVMVLMRFSLALVFTLETVRARSPYISESLGLACYPYLSYLFTHVNILFSFVESKKSDLQWWNTYVIFKPSHATWILLQFIIYVIDTLNRSCTLSDVVMFHAWLEVNYLCLLARISPRVAVNRQCVRYDVYRSVYDHPVIKFRLPMCEIISELWTSRLMEYWLLKTMQYHWT